MASQSARSTLPANESEAPGYRPLSGVAILGFVLGLLSILALLHPLFWVLPAGAVVAGWRALRRIRYAEGAVSGRSFAQLGLLFAGVFLAGGVSLHFLPRMLQLRQARATADAWFNALLSEGAEAADPYAVPPPVVDIETMVEQAPENMREQVRAQMQGMLEPLPNPLIDSLAARAEEVRVSYQRAEYVDLRGTPPTISLIYTIEYLAGQRGEHADVRVVLNRTPATEEQPARWLVDSGSFSRVGGSVARPAQ